MARDGQPFEDDESDHALEGAPAGLTALTNREHGLLREFSNGIGDPEGELDLGAIALPFRGRVLSRMHLVVVVAGRLGAGVSWAPLAFRRTRVLRTHLDFFVV